MTICFISSSIKFREIDSEIFVSGSVKLRSGKKIGLASTGTKKNAPRPVPSGV